MTHMFTFVVIVGNNASKINSCQFSLQQNARLFNNTYRNVSDHEDKLKDIHPFMIGRIRGIYCIQKLFIWLIIQFIR